jgi:hypothetical protein
MDVILHGINQHGRAIKILQHHRHVTVQGIADHIGQNRLAAPGAEHEMDVKAGERLRHDWIALTGLE